MRCPLALLVCSGLALGCNRQATQPTEESPGMLAIRWGGAAKGQFLAPATALLCQTDHYLEISAVRGDTGFGVTLVEADTVRIGLHPVVSPSAEVDWRPFSRTALRWIGEMETKGYEGSGGNIHVTQLVDRTISGGIDTRMTLAGMRDTVRVSGTFNKVAIRPDPHPCGRMVQGK